MDIASDSVAGFAKRRTPRPQRHAKSDSARGRGLGRHAPRYNLSRGLTMDSVPRDLRDALPDVDLETNQLSARSASCWKCKSRPAHGSKLRYCGRCESAANCSKPCERADWETHTPTSERLRQSHERALAAFVAQGGRAKNFNQRRDDLKSWFRKVPGFHGMDQQEPVTHHMCLSLRY
jgi:hypothetical protein